MRYLHHVAVRFMFNFREGMEKNFELEIFTETKFAYYHLFHLFVVWGLKVLRHLQERREALHRTRQIISFRALAMKTVTRKFRICTFVFTFKQYVCEFVPETR